MNHEQNKKIDFVTSSIAFNNELWRFQVPSHLKFKVYGNIKIKCPIIIIIIIIIIMVSVHNSFLSS